MNAILRTFVSLSILTVGATTLLAGCNSSAPGGGSGGGTTVTVSVQGVVPWLAAQDGSGAWQAMSGTTFKVTDAAGKYGVAWECTWPSGQPMITVIQATTAEATTLTASCQLTVPSTTGYTVSGTVSGIPTNGSALVKVGAGSASATDSSPTYSMSPVPGGLVAEAAFGFDGTSAPTKMVLNRSVNLTGDMPWDPNLTAGSPFTMNSVDIVNTPSGAQPQIFVSFTTAGGGGLLLQSATNSSSVSYPVVSPSLTQAGDEYLLQGLAYPGSATLSAVMVAQNPGGAVGLQLPSALPGSAGVSVVGGTGVATWGSATFPGASGPSAFQASVQPNATSSPWWRAEVSAGWMGSASSYTFPDLSATPNWTTSWDFPTGQAGYATVSAQHTNVTLDQLVAVVSIPYSQDFPNGATFEESLQGASGTY